MMIRSLFCAAGRFTQVVRPCQLPVRCYAVQVQRPAPDFCGTAVVNGDFKQIKLNDFRGRYLVLFFYPTDFTFVCPTEIIAFSDRMKEFEEAGAAVVGCSTDSQFSHLAWINKPRKEGGLGGVRFPLLSDIHKQISRDYGVLLEGRGVPLRGLFVINPEGIVRQITINDMRVGRSIDEVLRLVRAFRYTDENGEVCPANWVPNGPTIKPDLKKANEYFEKVN